jgi:excisionase family DNA binding protein
MQEREDRLLTVSEVAKYFRVEPESVRRWLREGKLLGMNLGRGPGWRVRLGDLELFIAERHTKPGLARDQHKTPAQGLGAERGALSRSAESPEQPGLGAANESSPRSSDS